MVVRVILVSIIMVYRLIPRRIRRVWSLGSSTSHLGLAAVQLAPTSMEAISAFIWFAGIQRTPDPASYHWRD